MIEIQYLSENEYRALDTFVQRLYAHHGRQVTSVVLFGSKARGDFGPESDVDLLVSLADDDADLRWDVQCLAARVSLEYDLLLSVRAVSRSQWAKLRRHRLGLYRAIETDGIDLTPGQAST